MRTGGAGVELDTSKREAGHQEGVESKHEGEDCWEGPTDARSA